MDATHVTKYRQLLSHIQEEDSEQLGLALLSEESRPQLSHDQLICLLRNAVAKGSLEMTRLLLSRQPHLGCASRRLLSPLWIAVLNEHYELARLLLERGAAIHPRLGRHPAHDRDSTMLHVAACLAGASRDYRLVELLLESGADADARDSSGSGVLQHVATMGDAELLGRLLRRGVRPTGRELHAAAFRRNAEQLLRLLVRHGSDPLARDDAGCNLLHTLAKGAAAGVGAAEFLLECGVSIHDVDGQFCRTPLHLAVSKNKLDLVELLLDRGADANARTEAGKSPLYLAATGDRPAILRLLLERGGAELEGTTPAGRTALHGACASLSASSVQLLLERGADLNAKDGAGNTPLALIEFKTANPSMRLVLKRLARRSFDGAFVEPSDLEIVDGHPRLREFYGSCLKELGRMRVKSLFNSLPLHCIFSKSTYSLSLLTKNARFVRAFESHDLTAFPLYAADLASTFAEAKDKRRLLCSTENLLSSMFARSLPHTAIRKVAFYANFV